MRLTIALACTTLAACTFGSSPPKSEEVENKLVEMFEEASGVKPERVDCPDGELKGKFQCTAFAGPGLDLTLDVEIKKSEGGAFSGWDLHFETANAMVGKTMAETMKKDLGAKLGVPVESVTCPPLLKHTPDLKFTCTAKTAQGELTIEATAAGEGINYRVAQ